jgi:hypothetical protein
MMHDGFLLSTVILGGMPAVLMVVALVWFRRSAAGGKDPPRP